VKPVFIDSDAERELAGSIDFYERRRAGLGLEFEQAARDAVRTIQAAPERPPMRRDGTRRYIMDRYAVQR
jgi:hypothetical protein